MAEAVEELKELVTRYPQMRDAVRMALVDALRNTAGNGKEWGGAIFQRGTQFYPTKAISSDDRFNVDGEVVADQPGDRGVAVYHTHPHGPDSNRFSRKDVEAAKALGLPSFVGVQSSGDVMTFDPKTDSADRIDARNRNDARAGSAAGRIYLKKDLLAQALRLANN